jgi:hypothetical protein
MKKVVYRKINTSLYCVKNVINLHGKYRRISKSNIKEAQLGTVISYSCSFINQINELNYQNFCSKSLH